jgi:hypothetical protein
LGEAKKVKSKKKWHLIIIKLMLAELLFIQDI